MKRLGEILIAAGFLIILLSLGALLVFVIDEYGLLSKEQALFPTQRRLPLDNCENDVGSGIRSFNLNSSSTAEKIPVLLYHRIVKEKNIKKNHYIDGRLNPMIVTKEMFEKQMAYLKKEGFVTLSLSELQAFLNEELEVPQKSVLLTFDDGYKDNFIEAYPILRKHNFHAVNFIITGAITKKNRPFSPKNVQYFSVKELQKACDVFEYQSHTYNYHKREGDKSVEEGDPYLVSKSPEQVYEDIKTSLFQLNDENLAFAYPYGEYSPSTIRILKDLHVKMAFTTENRAVNRNDHLYEIPRLSILASTTLEQFIDYVTIPVDPPF